MQILEKKDQLESENYWNNFNFYLKKYKVHAFHFNINYRPIMNINYYNSIHFT